MIQDDTKSFMRARIFLFIEFSNLEYHIKEFQQNIVKISSNGFGSGVLKIIDLKL